MGKRIFLLLPEAYEDSEYIKYYPKTEQFYEEAPDECVLLNVYEHYRMFYSKAKAAKLSLEILSGFDELWYSSVFGVSDIMLCMINTAKKLEIPVQEVHSINCKESFSALYRFVMENHPSRVVSDADFWTKTIKRLGECTVRNMPLNTFIAVSLIEYYERVYRGELPAVKAEETFRGEFRAALDFSVWSIKNNVSFQNGINLEKISSKQKPTPMLKALMDGFYQYFQIRQTHLEQNKIKKRSELT